MTSFAKGDAVINIITQFWIIGVFLDMMGYQVSAFFVAALLAGVAVSLEYGQPPCGVLSASAFTEMGQAIFPFVISRATYSGDSERLTDALALLWGKGLAEAVLVANSGLTHFLARFGGVLFTLHPRREAFGAFSLFDSGTVLAARALTIGSCVVRAKAADGFPLLALIAPLKAGGVSAQVFFKGDTHALGYEF